MKKFLNKNVGLIEIVTNKFVIEQYEKRPDIYEPVIETKPKAKKD